MRSRKRPLRGVSKPALARVAKSGAGPARIGVGRAGPRYPTKAWLKFRADHARAVDAVLAEVPADWPARNSILELHSRAPNREAYLLDPRLGRMLSEPDAERMAQRFARKTRAARPPRPRLVILLGDGLSSAAVVTHAAPLVRGLVRVLRADFDLMPPIFIRNARVRIEDHVGEILRPDIAVMIIGERPGLATAESLGAYAIWRPRLTSLEPDRTVISNIHPRGIAIAAAIRKIARLICNIADAQASGASLSAKLTRR